MVKSVLDLAFGGILMDSLFFGMRVSLICVRLMGFDLLLMALTLWVGILMFYHYILFV